MKHNKELWDKAKDAKVGETITCPACRKTLRKTSYQHKFCNTACKDDYWNDEPSRKEHHRQFRANGTEDYYHYSNDHLYWDSHKADG